VRLVPKRGGTPKSRQPMRSEPVRMTPHVECEIGEHERPTRPVKDHDLAERADRPRDERRDDAFPGGGTKGIETHLLPGAATARAPWRAGSVEGSPASGNALRYSATKRWWNAFGARMTDGSPSGRRRSQRRVVQACRGCCRNSLPLAGGRPSSRSAARARRALRRLRSSRQTPGASSCGGGLNVAIGPRFHRSQRRSINEGLIAETLPNARRFSTSSKPASSPALYRPGAQSTRGATSVP